VLLLSELIGSDVRSADGALVGRLVDLTVEAGEAHPAIRRLAIGRRRRIHTYVDWDSVSSVEPSGFQLNAGHLGAGAGRDDHDLTTRELCLARDVLDTQIVDVAGKRVARVSEVLLTRSSDVVRVVAVDISAAGVWRRVGLKRIAARSAERAVDWADLHLTSTRGHALALASPGAQVHRLGPSELGALVALLPTAKAAEVLAAVSPSAAAGALRAVHPHVGTRLLQAVPHGTASSVLALMPSDDASEVLRGLAPDAVDGLLSNLASERASMLRRLLGSRANTAGRLVAERPPGQGPYARIRRRARRMLPPKRHQPSQTGP
jgi:sporulation protein YlmC with PRC-barrel domain